MTKKCKYCGKEFIGKSNKKYCSPACQDAGYKQAMWDYHNKYFRKKEEKRDK